VISLEGRPCLVTGASGFLGSWVVERLRAAGARVRCLVRPTSRRDFLPADDPSIEYQAGDVTDPDSLRAAVAGVDLIFHLAGRIKAPRAADFDRVNRQGTVNLLDACQSTGSRLVRVLVVSSLAAAGPAGPGEVLTETAPCRPVSPYGRSKWAGEAAARGYGDRLPVTIVRPPTIYGPRDRETLLVFKVVARGLRPQLGETSAISLIHAADLADGILLAATHPAAVGRTYFLTGDAAPSLDQLVDLIGAAVGRRGVPVPVPPGAVRLAGRAAEVVRDLAGVPLIFDRWKADELLRGYWVCSNARARAELGFSPRIAVDQGLRDTARWYRLMGWL
jgi:dihydroflavonol-4-reductase